MDHRAEAWYRRRTSHWRDWPLGQLLEDKQRHGTRISRAPGGATGRAMETSDRGQLGDELATIVTVRARTGPSARARAGPAQ
jgi:hypothetical protein